MSSFLRNDAAGMKEQVTWSTGKPGVEDWFLGYEADTAAYYGRLGKARELSRHAVTFAERAEEKEVAARYHICQRQRCLGVFLRFGVVSKQGFPQRRNYLMWVSASQRIPSSSPTTCRPCGHSLRSSTKMHQKPSKPFSPAVS